MLTAQKKLLLVLLGVAVVVIFVFLAARFVFAPSDQTSNPVSDSNNVVVDQQPFSTTTLQENLVPLSINDEPAQVLSESDLYLVQIARLATEIFGTYSNQNDNSHLSDLQIIATPSFARYLRGLYSPLEEVYEGVTTRVISSKLVARSADRAEISFETQRQWSGSNNERLYAKANVRLQKIGENWLVDGIFWQQ